MFTTDDTTNLVTSMMLTSAPVGFAFFLGDYNVSLVNGPGAYIGGDEPGPPPIAIGLGTDSIPTPWAAAGGTLSIFDIYTDIGGGGGGIPGAGAYTPSKPVPEPSTSLLLATGLLGLASIRWWIGRRERTLVG